MCAAYRIAQRRPIWPRPGLKGGDAELCFGLTRASGAISELEWQIFLRDEVTKRFPVGLTAWEADGQWRTPAGKIDHERSKVLLIVHPDTLAARGSVQEMIEIYRRLFDQQSVLWESSRVCVAS